MAAYLLVHGAWHDERCWDLLVPELVARGHAVHTLTLPGHWDRPLSTFKVSLKLYAKAICTAAEQIAEPLVLVGHSMGGMAISKAAEMRPALFEQLVYLTAFVPQLNKWTQIRQLARSDPHTQLGPALHQNWLKFQLHILSERAASLFYHDCDHHLAANATSRLSVQSGRPLIEFSKSTPNGVGALKKTYIECLQDRVISLDLQRRMQQFVPFDRVMSLDSSHSPFLSQPHQLAEMLHRITTPHRARPRQIRPGFLGAAQDKNPATGPLAGAQSG